MSDTAVTTPAAQPASAPTEPATEATVVEAPAQETDWKAEARKWEDRAKANKSAAEKLAEIEEASKTADQKAAERLQVAEKRAVDLEQKADRAEVAAEKGIPIGLIHGTTRAEMEAAADALIAFKGTPDIPSTPRPDPSQGAKGEAAALNGDPLLDTLKNKLGLN